MAGCLHWGGLDEALEEGPKPWSEKNLSPYFSRQRRILSRQRNSNRIAYVPLLCLPPLYASSHSLNFWWISLAVMHPRLSHALNLVESSTCVIPLCVSLYKLAAPLWRR